MIYSTLVSPELLAMHANDPHWVVLDCRFSLGDPSRGRRDYAQGHLPGAVHADLHDDLSGPIVPGRTGRHPLPDIDAFADKLGAWGISVDTQVVAYDEAAGTFAARPWWMLRYMGHDAVAVLDGGLRRWRSEGRPMTTEIPQPHPCSFVARARRDRVANSADVLARLDDPAWVIVDSRTPERYRGEVEPIDPVAGHIRGAINLPFTENVDERGVFLPTERLRRRFEPPLAGRGVDHTIFYCGSGVTAAHNLLAVAHAGLGDALLYAGSWSEWITDPARPIQTG